MPQEFTITRDEAIQTVAAELDGPTSFDEIAERVLQLWPSKARNPKTGIRDALRFYNLNYGLAPLDPKRKVFVPLRIGLRNMRFRMIVSEEEASRGILFFDESVKVFLPYHLRLNLEEGDQIELRDQSGTSLPVKPRLITFTVETAIGPQKTDQFGYELTDWFLAHNVQADDSVICTIVDWITPILQLEHEPVSERNDDAIQVRNEELTNILFDMLEDSRDERIQVRQAVLDAHLRLSDPRGYPGDPWPIAVDADERMRWDFYEIKYADGSPDFFDLLMGGMFSPEEGFSNDPEYNAPELTPEEANAIYVFKAALKHRKSLWRRIEIQGGQTLADFNSILVDAFDHDWDHMGGFWKRVRRGKSRRFREVDLGSVDPMGGGDGAHVTLAKLELSLADEIKYVFDFGDWYEHILTLEDVIPANEAGTDIEYPRIVAQNRPRYRYCGQCKEEERKTVAIEICIDCSNQEQRDVLVCAECSEKYHEEHYIDEILY